MVQAGSLRNAPFFVLFRILGRVMRLVADNLLGDLLRGRRQLDRPSLSAIIALLREWASRVLMAQLPCGLSGDRQP